MDGVHLEREDATYEITLGAVTVRGLRPSEEQIARNITAGQQALERGVKALLKPGVRLYPKKNVPLYSVSDDDVNVYIRKLNGKADKGRIVDGEFQVIDQ